MTAHEIVLTDERLAMRFSQHGASARHDGRQASWGGIGPHRWNGLDVAPGRVGAAATLYSAGVVSRDADGVLTGRVIRERAALQRSLA